MTDLSALLPMLAQIARAFTTTEGGGGLLGVASNVGGRVIQEHPTNAKEITALLAGRMPETAVTQGEAAQASAQTQTPPARTPQQPGGSRLPSYSTAQPQTGPRPATAVYSGLATQSPAASLAPPNSPAGTRSRPFAVEIGQESCRNLAKLIAEQTKAKDPHQGAWAKFREGFTKGHEGAADRSPLRALGKTVGRWLGMPQPEEDKPAKPEPEGFSLRDLVKRNAERLSQARQSFWSPNQSRTARMSRQAEALRPEQMATGDILAANGEPSKQSFSTWIKGAPAVPATPAANALGATVGEGAGMMESLGVMIGELADPITAVVAVGTAAWAAVKGVEKLGEATIESYRDMTKFAPKLAILFAAVDRQSLILGARYAYKTSGSAMALGSQWMGLKEQLQPIKEALGTFSNTAIAGLTTAIRGVLFILKPQIYILTKISECFEALMNLGADDKAAPIAAMLSQMRNMRFHNANRKNEFKNRRVGE
jgi:hypothetical protein